MYVRLGRSFIKFLNAVTMAPYDIFYILYKIYSFITNFLKNIQICLWVFIARKVLVTVLKSIFLARDNSVHNLISLGRFWKTLTKIKKRDDLFLQILEKYWKFYVNFDERYTWIRGGELPSSFRISV